jgi:hypothetical protein
MYPHTQLGPPETVGATVPLGSTAVGEAEGQ